MRSLVETDTLFPVPPPLNLPALVLRKLWQKLWQLVCCSCCDDGFDSLEEDTSAVRGSALKAELLQATERYTVRMREEDVLCHGDVEIVARCPRGLAVAGPASIVHKLQASSSLVSAETAELQRSWLALCGLSASVLRLSLGLLGIRTLERL